MILKTSFGFEICIILISLEIASIIPERMNKDQRKPYLIVRINITFLGTTRESFFLKYLPGK